MARFTPGIVVIIFPACIHTGSPFFGFDERPTSQSRNGDWCQPHYLPDYAGRGDYLNIHGKVRVMFIWISWLTFDPND
jgi:hypothetical protein